MTAPNALVVGETLIDEVIDAERVSRRPGGSPANVAVGLARLGIATRLHTAIGDDADGGLITKWLAEAGVKITPESVTDAATSKAAAVLSPDGSARYHFSLGWAPSPIADLGHPTLLHAGSLGAFLDPGAEVTRDAIRRGGGLGSLVSFDPNVRSSLLADVSRAHRVFAELASSSQLVKMSDEDAEYLHPGVPPEDVLDRLIQVGVNLAVITCGPRGALLASGRERATIPAPPARVADTVGAGDSFMAALIWALVFDGAGWDGQPISLDRLEQVGRTAVRAAAITVSRTGADLPTIRELNAERENA